MYKSLADIILKGSRNKAIIDASSGKSITYGELNKKVLALACLLKKKGFKEGDKAGIISRNSIEYVITLFAVIKAGGIAVPIDNTWESKDVIKVANECCLTALYIKGKKDSIVKKIKHNVKTLKISIDSFPEDSNVVFKDKETDINKPALIVYTSGTTRKPLGVILSHKSVLSSSTSIVKYAKILPKDRALCVLPFYHIYGLSILFSNILKKASVVLENRFMYPTLALRSIEKYKATSFAGVFSHYDILCNKTNFKRRKLSSVRYFMQAGDAMHPSITKGIISAFPKKKLYIMYGQTEASPRITYIDEKKLKIKPKSVGKAVPGVKVKVVNKNGKECEKYKTGEVVVKGKNIMLGYLGNKRETKRALKRGWLYTGDKAFKDNDGDLFIVGRIKDLVKI